MRTRREWRRKDRRAQQPMFSEESSRRFLSGSRIKSGRIPSRSSRNDREGGWSRYSPLIHDQLPRTELSVVQSSRFIVILVICFITYLDFTKVKVCGNLY